MPTWSLSRLSLFLMGLVSVPLLLSACDGSESDDDDHEHTPTATATSTFTATPTSTATATQTPLSGVGTLALTFRIDTDWMDAMSEPAVGPVWGDLFLGSDVTNLGPNAGAEAVGSVYIEQVDLTPGGGPTAILITTEPLPAGEVAFLGFMDSDGNADPDAPGPDRKDPVTFPADNRFTVRPDQETTVEVFFGLLNP